ncbi:MAG: hypothetical protein K8W52_46200 [Deltaproteobacteria bacterium]|nr:hypothetical protein [Deltaproteobacteria bacterium]
MSLPSRLRAALTVAVLAAAPAAYADEIARGAVVRVEDGAAYVNLGQARGVATGAPIRFKRPIALRHPVTRKVVEDWLPIGGATITAVGDQLTRVVVSAELAAQLRPGDIAEIYVERAAPAPPPPPTPVADPTPVPVVPAPTAEVLALWTSLAGQPLDARIAAWEGWLAGHATSPYAETVRGDLAVLEAARDQLAPPRRPSELATATPLDHAAPTLADRGRAIPLVFVSGAHPPTSAWLHYRTIGDATYHRELLVRDHDRYLRGEIPAATVIAPGVEYFVEATTATGAQATAYATPREPATVAIAAPPLTDAFGGERHRTRLSLATTYLDFATFDHRAGDHRDRAQLTEADVLYRIGPTLYGVRVGFGQFTGTGGRKDAAWTPTSPAPTVGFTYGYAEAELHADADGTMLGAALRLISGVGDDGFGMGIQGKVRIGDPDASNLSLSAGTTAEVGFLSELRFETSPRPPIAVAMAVGVTDQPGAGDLGVRVSTELGWRARPWFVPTARVSWQGRSAAHAGLGAGLAMVFDW